MSSCVSGGYGFRKLIGYCSHEEIVSQSVNSREQFYVSTGSTPAKADGGVVWLAPGTGW